MYAAESFVLRASIVLGLVAAVVTILYFSPMPDQFFKSCDRPCHILDTPMICRVKLTIDSLRSINSKDCYKTNGTNCANPDFGFLLANNLIHGPSIHVCQNDVLLVEVVNKLPGRSITIHWRGQNQKESPFMDGVPMITQCPINSYSTFQYKFRASSAGTHLWQAFAGAELAEGIFGALIVRRPIKLDPQKKLYDFDDKDHLILISELRSDASPTLLINGRSKDSPTVYEVVKGKRYRFRVGFGGGITSCPVNLTVEEHSFKVISLDGTAIVPLEANAVVLGKGERVDIVLKADREVKSFAVKVASVCEDVVGEASLNYIGDTRLSSFRGGVVEGREFNTGLCQSQVGRVCLGDVHAVRKLPKALKKDVDRTIYLPFDFKVLETGKDFDKIYRLNNLTFTYPPSPLLTQIQDVPSDAICSSHDVPERCKAQEICECVHIEHIPLGTTVELILIDQGGDLSENIFHLHGNSFYVVASKTLDVPIPLAEIKSLNARGALFKRNTISPILKDTVRVPRRGIVAARFIADNPGFWMLRDGNARHWTRGMDVILHVGTPADIPPTPSSFPTCGSWVGPEFFLL